MDCLAPESQRMYDIAKSLRGRHLSLNENIPHELGCAEAVSYVLKQIGYDIPKDGIAGTYNLYEWLLKSQKFLQVKEDAAMAGDVIISPTGLQPKTSPLGHGHVGIMGKQSIMSNDSFSGLWSDYFNLPLWKDRYETFGRFPVLFFRPI